MRLLNLLFLACLFPFSLDAQKIESKLLYEMKEGEKIIHSSEHRLDFTGDQSGFLLFVQRKGLHYANLNGKEIGPFDKIYAPYISIEDFATNSFFHFVYEHYGKKYLYLNGNTLGPYDQLSPKGNSAYHLPIIDKNHYLFGFSRNGKSYLNYNGKEFGPYEEVFAGKTTYQNELYIDEAGNYAFRYKNNGKYYFHINNKEYGPYDEFDVLYDNLDLSQLSRGYFYFSAMKDGKKYYNIDGKEFGPFDYERRGAIIRNNVSGETMAKIAKNGKEYLLFNGQEIGPFDRIVSWDLKPEISYYEYEKSGSRYIKIDDLEYGPYGKIIGSKFISANNWNYVYTDARDPLKIYLRLNGQPPIGPYDWIDENNVLRNEEGSTGFVFQKSDGYYVYVNGKEFGPYQNRNMNLQLIGNIDYIYAFQKKDKTYVQLNDKKKMGPYVEVKEIKALDAGHFFYLYRKSLETNNEWYLNVNGKEDYGPYQFIYAHFDENKNVCFSALKDENGKRTHFVRSRNINYGPYQNAYFIGNSSDFRFRDENGTSFEVIQDKVAELVTEKANDIVVSSRDERSTLRYRPDSGELFFNGKKMPENYKTAFGFSYSEYEKLFYFMSLDANKIMKHIIR